LADIGPSDVGPSDGVAPIRPSDGSQQTADGAADDVSARAKLTKKGRQAAEWTLEAFATTACSLKTSAALCGGITPVMKRSIFKIRKHLQVLEKRAQLGALPGKDVPRGYANDAAGLARPVPMGWLRDAGHSELPGDSVNQPEDRQHGAVHRPARRHADQ
jgi:hypothetical protein